MGYIYQGNFLDTNRFMLGIPVKKVLKHLASDTVDSIYPVMSVKEKSDYPASTFNGYHLGYEPKDEFDTFIKVYRQASAEVEKYLKSKANVSRLEDDEYFVPIYSKWVTSSFIGSDGDTFLKHGFLFMYEKFPVLWTEIPIGGFTGEDFE